MQAFFSILVICLFLLGSYNMQPLINGITTSVRTIPVKHGSSRLDSITNAMIICWLTRTHFLLLLKRALGNHNCIIVSNGANHILLTPSPIPILIRAHQHFVFLKWENSLINWNDSLPPCMGSFFLSSRPLLFQNQVPDNVEVNCLSEDGQLQVVPRYINYISSPPEINIRDFYSV